MLFFQQNAVRIARALFEIMLHKHNPLMAGRFLQLCLMLEHQLWDTESEMRQFHILGPDIINKIEGCSGLNIHKLREMDSKEIGKNNQTSFTKFKHILNYGSYKLK